MTTRPVRADDRPMTGLALAPPETDPDLVARLRAGDEAAFGRVVDDLSPLMLRLALGHVRTRAVAEEVVQEAWLAVLTGLPGFEGRSSLKTWVLSILVHKAKTRAIRERRTIPFASLAGEPDEPAVEPGRFRAAHEPFAGHWRAYPANWGASPDTVAEDRETMRVVMGAIAALPAAQQTVIRMRDIEGCSAEEVCATLDVSEGNQRVLLHRARSRVRAALEVHLGA
jgi:RNA polymerase sigma-70 factor (ECF subfamily)